MTARDTSTGDLFARIERAAAPALEHAEAVAPGWAAEALAWIAEAARTRQVFLVEDVRLEAEAAGFQKPPSRRAWGAVAIQARKDGLIERDGYAMSTAPTANPHPVTRWRSRVFGRRSDTPPEGWRAPSPGDARCGFCDRPMPCHCPGPAA